MHRSFTYSILLLVGSAAVFTSCKEVCKDEALPQYTLSAGQRAWTDPFTPSTTWRFRNAAGYQRTYRIESRDTYMNGGGGGKSSFCPSYYKEELTIRFTRTDSVAKSPATFYLSAQSPVPNSMFEASIQWDAQSFYPPIEQAETTGAGLTAVTFNGRTYPQAMEVKGLSDIKQPSSIVRLYLTKTDGIIRFEEKNGTMWDRL